MCVNCVLFSCGVVCVCVCVCVWSVYANDMCFRSTLTFMPTAYKRESGHAEMAGRGTPGSSLIQHSDTVQVFHFHVSARDV